MEMIDFPSTYQYTRSHDWLEKRSNTRYRIGVTEIAQDLLGIIVYIELPELGTEYRLGESYGCLESVKTVSDLCVPQSGKVVAVNNQLSSNPELVNMHPYSQGWLIEIEVDEQGTQADVMSAEQYAKWVQQFKKE